MPTLMEQPIPQICSPDGTCVTIDNDLGQIDVQCVAFLKPGEETPQVLVPGSFTVKRLPDNRQWAIVWTINTDLQVDSASFRDLQGDVFPSSRLPPGVNLSQVPDATNACKIWLANTVTEVVSFEYDLIVKVVLDGQAVRAQVVTVHPDDLPKTIIDDPTIVVTMEPMG
jgi:hypothetical protein